MQGDIKWLEFGKEIHDYRKVIWAQAAMDRFVKKLRGRFAMGKNSRVSSRDVELRRSSLCPSRPVASTVVWLPRQTETSQGKLCLFPSAPGGFTPAAPRWLSGFPVHRRVTPLRWPPIRFLFVGSEFCFTLPSDPASRRTPLFRLAVPVITTRRGLSPLRYTTCLAHQETSGADRPRSSSYYPAGMHAHTHDCYRAVAATTWTALGVMGLGFPPPRHPRTFPRSR
jgi:hypothetical protein